jgi:hypothetical protein
MWNNRYEIVEMKRQHKEIMEKRRKIVRAGTKI